MKHAHICSLGWTHKPILEPIMGGGLPCDTLYLLWNDDEKINETLNLVKEALSKANNKIKLNIRTIDPYDYNSVIKEVTQISREEKKDRKKDVKLYINITLGTGIIVGALCASSYFTEAQVYYYLDSEKYASTTPLSELIKMIDTPKIPDIDRMDPKRKRIISFLADQERPVSKKEVMNLFRPYKESDKALGSITTHHLNGLRDGGLIKIYDNEKDRREREIMATDLGIMLALWLPENDD